MIYHVTANFREETARLFLSRLSDGSIAVQKPDGQEIVASMNRAVVLPDGRIAWTQTCFCRIPLAHERETVLEAHFDNITATAIFEHVKLDGAPFLDLLEALI